MKVKALFIFTFNSQRIKNQYRYEADTHCPQALVFLNATWKHTQKDTSLKESGPPTFTQNSALCPQIPNIEFVPLMLCYF